MEHFNFYQSANSERTTVLKNFIVHRAEFKIIMDSLTLSSPTTPAYHELILGRRGSGKTTLLKRIEIEIEDKLNKKYIPIHLPEEQASIYRLFDLLIEVIEELKRRFSFQITLKDYSEFDIEKDYTSYLYEQIHEFCNTQNKSIVLFLDNFDRIVENITDDGDMFHEILTNYNDLIIIAASTRIDEHFWKQDKRIHKSFRQHQLDALTIDEIKKLLIHWASVTNTPELKKIATQNSGKLQTIRIISDSLPRTFKFFILLELQYSFANENADYIKMIMDNVTPLYQARINNLPPQLRKIVMEMAFIWEACSTKNLTKQCRMESKLISADLKTLAEKGIVEKIETDNRNLLYRISERFFNMWLIMTQGNSVQKQKAKWLTNFLENWYNNSTCIEIRNCKKTLDLACTAENVDDGSNNFDLGTIDRIQRIYSEAEKYYLLAIDKGQVGALFNLGNLYVNKQKFVEAEKQYLLAIEKGHIGAMYNLGLLCANQGKFAEAEKYYLMAIEKGDVEAMYNLALMYFNLNNYTLAEKYYLLAIEKEHISAMFNLGNLYTAQGNFTDAEKCFLLATKRGHINAMCNLGNLYANQNKFEEAEKQYLLAIENGHIGAMCNLGNLYTNKRNFSEAEKYYLMAIERQDVSAIYNLGVLNDYQDKFADAEKCYLLAIEKGYVNAMYNLGVLYDNQGNTAQAEKYYLLAVNINNNNAFRNLAAIYYSQNNKQNALSYIQQYKGCDDCKIIIEIWNGIFEDIEKRSLEVIKAEPESLASFIINLLIHQQKALVLNLFNHPEAGKFLQDKLKILHYVCLILNKKTENNLALRIPQEIQPTIDEVISFIKKKEKFYKYKR